jgi:hypothetical protein
MVLTFQPNPAPMRLWLVAYTTDNNDNLDMVVSAPTPIEAFVRWRARMTGIEPYTDPAGRVNNTLYTSLVHDIEMFGDERAARVFPIPVLASMPYVHYWDFIDGGHFDINMDTLATKAIEEEIKRMIPPGAPINTGVTNDMEC